MAQILEKVTDRDPRGFSDICELIPSLKLRLEKSQLSPELADLQKRDVIEYKMYLTGYHKFCKHHWRPFDIRRITNQGYKGNNTGVFLWGE